MDAFSRWVKHSSPLVKMTMAIALTSGLVVVNKLFYGPYTRRRRLKEAEEWANDIIEQEERLNAYEK